MKIAITGYSGFIGNNLCRYLESHGYEILRIDRNVLYNDLKELIWYIEQADYFIHLSGSSILKRWTKKNKEVIWNSRIVTGKIIYLALKSARIKPKALFFSSAIGIYNSSGIHDENSSLFSEGFIKELIMEWENVGIRVQTLGIPTVIMRFGIVLGKNGGALKSMIVPFKFGLGSKIGHGDQLVPFIHIEDLCNIIKFLIEKSCYIGIINFVSPNVTTNKILSKSLANKLGRPCFFTVPKFFMKLIYGEASILLTEGQNVVPAVLKEIRYEYLFPKLDDVLEDLIE